MTPYDPRTSESTPTPPGVDRAQDPPLEEDTNFPPGHANPTGAAVAGGVTGAAFGSIGGPIGALAGALGGAVVGAAAERLMHVDDDTTREWVAPSVMESADPTTLLAVQALSAESQHPHEFVNGVCACGAETDGMARSAEV